MKKIYLCKDCGTLKSRKGIYCKQCSYQHRTRRSGLKYNIKVINKGWIRKGQRLSPETEFQPTNEPYLDNNTGYMKIHRNTKYHRHVIAESIGRILLPDELIHHVNGDKTDNRIENLKIMTRSEHMKLHWSERNNYE